MLLWHLLAECPFDAGFCQTCKIWRALDVLFGNCRDPDGKLVYRAQGTGDMATTKTASKVFKSKTHDAKEGTELMADLVYLLKIKPGFENKEYVTSSQLDPANNKGKARAEALNNPSLGNFTTVDNELIKSYKGVEFKSSIV